LKVSFCKQRGEIFGRIHDGDPSTSTPAVTPVFSIKIQEHEAFSRKGDTVAAERMKIKLRGKAARRDLRYRCFEVKTVDPKKTVA
jgi:hypothetical protein